MCSLASRSARSAFGRQNLLPFSAQRQTHHLSRNFHLSAVRYLANKPLTPTDDVMAGMHLSQEQIQGMRKPYRSKHEIFDISTLASKDPIDQFTAWFDHAANSDTGIYEANAMTLATASKEGRPSCRMVLLKGYDHQGFKFFTNFASRKSKELVDNPFAELVFYWTYNHQDVTYSRQVRIEGRVERLSEQEADEYFHSRPKASQVAALVSKQSQVIASREVLDSEFERLSAEYANKDMAKPASWGGFRVVPEAMEFWQGQTNRLHDRLLFRRPAPGETIHEDRTHRGENGWLIERLSP